jgi:L-malate glycosyltransferase
VSGIHQLLPAAQPYDAITEQAFAWRDLIREWGYESEIVSEHVEPAVAGEVRPLDGIGKHLVRTRPFILRYALWSKTVDYALSATEPVAVCYHNITPGELLRDFNPDLADLCDRGRNSLGVFRGRVDALVADSSFNAAELRQAGIGEANIVPLLLTLPTEVPRRKANREPIILTVGRVVSSKRVEDVIKAFTLYQRHRSPDATLIVVGSERGFENYRRALDLLAERLRTRRVIFTGPISAEARDFWYRRADAYLSMSAHEGFCAPVVEALAHGVPVVARAAGAVPETLGGAGVVLEGDDLALAAEALHEVVSSRETRRLLGDAAERRLAELSPEAITPLIRRALTPLLEAG